MSRQRKSKTLSLAGLVINVLLYGSLVFLVMIGLRKLRNIKDLGRSKGSKKVQTKKTDKKMMMKLAAVGVLLTGLSALLVPASESKISEIAYKYPPLAVVLYPVINSAVVSWSDSDPELHTPSYSNRVCLSVMPDSETITRGFPVPVLVHETVDSNSGCERNVDSWSLYVVGVVVNSLLYGGLIYLVVIRLRKLRAHRK